MIERQVMVEDAYLHTGTTTRKAQPLPYRERETNSGGYEDRYGTRRPRANCRQDRSLHKLLFPHWLQHTAKLFSEKQSDTATVLKQLWLGQKNHGTTSIHCLYCVQAYDTEANDRTPSATCRQFPSRWDTRCIVSNFPPLGWIQLGPLKQLRSGDFN